MTAFHPSAPDEDGFGEERLDGINVQRFEREFKEKLEKVLDLRTWSSGPDFPALYEGLEREVEEAARQDDRVARAIRDQVFPWIKDRTRRNVPPLAGHHELSPEVLEKIHRTTLFTGEVEACDGTVLVHESIALTIIQLGVCLVSYSGEEGTWSHRLFRRDLRGTTSDPIQEAHQLLELRGHRAAVGQVSGQDRLSELGRRGLMTYAERAVLAGEATAPWRLGHGSPAPYELLTGAGAVRVLERGLDQVEHLLLEHRRFAFVPSAPRQRALLTIGLALRPLEFAVVHTLRTYVEDMVRHGNLRGKQLKRATDFVETAGEQVAVGVYRASRAAPPYVFYAPADPELCMQAAAIVMADATLQSHRGFPLLLDMADQLCHVGFGHADFMGAVGATYAAHDRPFTYLSERETRP
jgi:hypothetical protein